MVRKAACDALLRNSSHEPLLAGGGQPEMQRHLRAGESEPIALTRQFPVEAVVDGIFSKRVTTAGVNTARLLVNSWWGVTRGSAGGGSRCVTYGLPVRTASAIAS